MNALSDGSFEHYDIGCWMLLCKADVLNCANDLLHKKQGLKPLNIPH